MRRLVIVSLASAPGKGIRGILWEARGDWFVIRNAAAVDEARPQPTPIDGGEIVLHRSNIEYFQVL